MSHEAIAAIWTQLEERTDLATTLRDAIGQYSIQTAIYHRKTLDSEVMGAFSRLISTVRTAFHLQRVYLQSRQPSNKIETFLVEPSIIIEVLIFLLKVQDDCLLNHRDSGPNDKPMLRSIGAMILAGLRLLAMYKRKVSLPIDMDWSSQAELLKSKLANWPLEDRVHRILIGELCIGILKDLSTTSEIASTTGLKPLCEYHNDNSGTGDDADLPDFYDGLYPLKFELMDDVSRALRCITCQCPWWFRSFCIWYDIWSALLGASVQLYRHTASPYIDASGETLALLVIKFIQEVEDCEAAGNNLRLGAIIEVFYAMNPFPQCSADGCHCFGHNIQHQYQNLRYPGVWSQATTGANDLQLHVAADLERRKQSLRDADGYTQQIINSVQESVRRWTDLEEDPTPKLQLSSYIVNCPQLHPFTSETLTEILEERTQNSAAEAVQEKAEIVEIGSLRCPMCVDGSLTQARLITPLSVFDQLFQEAPRLDHNLRDSSLKIKGLPDRPKRISQSSKSLNSSSSRSIFKAFQGNSSSHMKKDSVENTSQGSPKSKLARKFKSDSSLPNLQVSSVIFTDGKFVLSSTSTRVACYDCELETWSKGHSFTKVILIAGSSVRYAVVSKEIQICKMTVFRRDRIFEGEEWSKCFEMQPQSIAISRQGHKIALGFEKTVHLFDGGSVHVEVLRSVSPQNDKPNLRIDSQQLSFSPCGNHLVIASRVAREGKVFVVVHDLHPLRRQTQPMSDLPIPTKQPGDFGLSSVIYDATSSSVFISSSAAQEHPWLMDRVNPRDTHKMTNKQYKPFPGEQIQCAVAVPGDGSQIAMVNHSNKIFMLRRDEYHWKFSPIKVKMESSRGEIVRADDRMSVAAMDGGIRFFWTQGQDGRMLTITPTDESDQEWKYNLEKIPFPFRNAPGPI